MKWLIWFWALLFWILSLLSPGSASAGGDSSSTRIQLDPVIGGSFSLFYRDNSLGSRVTYWAGSNVLVVNRYISTWVAFQRTILSDSDQDGVGPKFLAVIANDEFPRVFLLAGGGWLNNFNRGVNGDPDKDAMTLDLGILYEFLADQIYVGVLGSAINTRRPTLSTIALSGHFDQATGSQAMEYETRLDWSIDVGIVGRF